MKAGNSRSMGIIEKFSRTKTIILSAGSFLLIAVLVNVLIKPGFSYLTQTFGYDSAYVYQLLERIGPEGRNAHRFVLAADLLMVLCYTAALMGLNYRVFGALSLHPAALHIVTFSPPLLAIAQLTEMVSLLILLTSYPTQLQSLANWCNIVTIIKTVLTPMCFITPAIGWGLSLLRRRRMKIEQNRTN